MENTNRSVFGIHGVTGMLIATVLLLSILGVLTYLGILAQQDAASKPYSLKNPEKIIFVGLVILAALTAWSVLTPNHFFVA